MTKYCAGADGGTPYAFLGRGYGAKDCVDHPDTPRRAAEVEAIKTRLAGAGRKAVQEALMPYATLLLERFRRPNERIDEPLAAPAADPQEVSPA